MSEQAIPVTIIAGFLGAGKTTLLNYILHGQHGKRVAVLVNDFGSVNIDAELVVGVDDGLVSLTNGCICCSIRNDLQLAVVRLVRLPQPPEHIIIETSGVSDPAMVAQMFYDPDLWQVANLDAIITLVDAEQAPELIDEAAQLAELQIKAADLILLNKVDLLDADRLLETREWLKKIKSGTPVFEVTYGRAPLEVLLSPEMGFVRPDIRFESVDVQPHIHQAQSGSEHDHVHTHELVFDTWDYEQTEMLHMGQVQSVISSLPPTIYRVKGFLYLAEQPANKVVLQMVGRRVAVSDGGSWSGTPQTRLVFISQQEAVNYQVIQQALDNCRYKD